MPSPTESELDQSLPQKVRRDLAAQRDSVYAEMVYLRDIGGRSYRIVNGERIRREKVGSIYQFEMESELYLAEDAPIAVDVDKKSVRGAVVSCENSKVTLSLQEDLGEKVAVAFIRAEPWKLLDALNQRLKTLNPRDNPLAVQLMQNGPGLATRNPISMVKTGQEAAKAHVKEHDITVIWGPPGTGKTHTMAEIAISYVIAGKKVLAVSHSNVSVDGIVLKVAELMRKRNLQRIIWNAEVLRFGHVRDEVLDADEDLCAHRYAISCNPELKDELADLAKRREELKQEDARISQELAAARRSISEVHTATKASRESQSLRDELDSLKRNKQTLRSRKAQITDEMVSIQKRTNQIRKIVNEDEIRAVDHARMVATTASKMYANKFFEGRKYDLVLFDEVSMAYVPQIVCAAMHASKKLVLVGDFRQLAPIASGPGSKEALTKDIFSYLGITDRNQVAHYHPWLVMLNEQRRMHPAISAFSSNAFYDRLLKDHVSVVRAREGIASLAPVPGSPMTLVNLRGTYCASASNADHSRFNILGAIVSFGLALTAVKNGTTSVGVIAPYIAQVRLVRSMVEDYQERLRKGMVNLADIAISTVHQFQGSERDVIILDAVESYPARHPGVLTYKNVNGSVDRLVNVAVTRARGKLLTVANEDFWDERTAGEGNAFGRLCRHHRVYDTVLSARDGSLRAALSDLDLGPYMTFVKPEDAEGVFLADLRNANLRVVFSFPDGKLEEPYATTLYQAVRSLRSRGIEVLAKCRDYDALSEDWRTFTWQSDDAIFPLVVIDGEVCWYGMPPSRMKPPVKEGVRSLTTLATPIRITGYRTINMIWTLANMNQRKSEEASQVLKERHGTKGPSDDGKGSYGLAAYIKERKRCPRCKSPMALARSYKKGSFYLKCSSCDHIDYLTPEDVNHYISSEQVACPRCGGSLYARVSKFGLYIKCDGAARHTIKPNEI